MRIDADLTPGRPTIYLLIGVVATGVAVVLVLTGWTGMLTWLGLALGLTCLLIGAAQRSSLRHGPDGKP